MSQRDPDVDYQRLDQALDFWLRQFLKQVHTSVPGIVRRYTDSSKRAEVQIALNLLIGRYSAAERPESHERPTILDVPVLQPSAGGYVVHFPLRAGDAVMLLFSERGLDAFKQRYAVSDPTPGAFFLERDAVAIPGFGARSISPAGSGVTVQTEDGRQSVEVNASGNINITATTAVTIDAPTITLRGATDTLVVP